MGSKWLGRAVSSSLFLLIYNIIESNSYNKLFVAIDSSSSSHSLCEVTSRLSVCLTKRLRFVDVAFNFLLEKLFQFNSTSESNKFRINAFRVGKTILKVSSRRATSLAASFRLKMSKMGVMSIINYSSY